MPAGAAGLLAGAVYQLNPFGLKRLKVLPQLQHSLEALCSVAFARLAHVSPCRILQHPCMLEGNDTCRCFDG